MAVASVFVFLKLGLKSRLFSIHCCRHGPVRNVSLSAPSDPQRARRAVSAGEWLVDSKPDIENVMLNSAKFERSLLKRIRVRSIEEACRVVTEVKDAHTKYKNAIVLLENKERLLKDARDNYEARNIQLSKLDFETLKQSVKSAKANVNESLEMLLFRLHCLPNILLEEADSDDPCGVLQEEPPVTLPTEDKLKSINKISRVDEVCSSNLMSAVPDHIVSCSGSSYLAASAAVLEYRLMNYVGSFLEQCAFTELSCPSFIRQDILDAMGIDAEEYHCLLTKRQLHEVRSDSDVDDALDTRLVKPEDDYIYRFTGVTEWTLAAFFMRQLCSDTELPKQVFAMGNQYQLQGKAIQSKVAVIFCAARTKDESLAAYHGIVELLSTFYRHLDVPVIMKTVAPNNLLHHEAAALEVWTNVSNRRNAVVSRLAISFDYLSRRLMSKTGADSFIYQVSGDFVNMTNLLRAYDSGLSLPYF